VENKKNFESVVHSDFNTYLPFHSLPEVMGNSTREPDSLETIATVSSVNSAFFDTICAINSPLGDALFVVVVSGEVLGPAAAKEQQSSVHNREVFIGASFQLPSEDWIRN
jgi:hypothetical protein